MKDKRLASLSNAICEHLKGVDIEDSKITVVDVERIDDVLKTKIEVPEFVGKMLTKNENGQFVEIEGVESVVPI